MLLVVVVHGKAGGQGFFTPSDTLNKPRRNAVYITGGALGVGTLGALYGAWYAQYEQQPFHFTPDWNNWNQMDKMGHAWSAYSIGTGGYDLLRWTGVGERQAAFISAGYGWGFLMTVEVMDGFSSGWGFSWGDVAFNTAGSGLFLAQQLGWHEQRFQVKFSYHPTEYAAYRPDLLGSEPLERVLKDYNGQTYWLNTNLHDFGVAWMPEWLVLSVGYGSTGMISAEPDPALEAANGVVRQRRILLSVDLDLTRIKTKSAFLNGLFSVVNVLKIPAPTLSFDMQTQTLQGYVLYF